ncbi:MAG TPA: hypothetical protein VFV33_24370 [Gemmatimonadaceae bacterium]|nr:hypothetical protein [Gemmatimonadaceae bacterium]
MAPTDREEPTLATLLAALSRRLPEWGLEAMMIGGLAITAAILFFDPPWWRVVSLFTLLSAFGAWGIGERERGAVGKRGLVFTAMRTVAGLAAGASLVVIVLLFFRTFLGTWIS